MHRIFGLNTASHRLGTILLCLLAPMLIYFDSRVVHGRGFDDLADSIDHESFGYDPLNVFGLPTGAVQAGGKLFIGGGGDLPDYVIERFIELAGGCNARIVVIPSAHPYEDKDDLLETFSGWRSFRVSSFDFLHTDEPNEADDAEFCAVLEQATGVWLPGGAQARLAHRYGQRRVEALIHEVLVRGGIVGGTSAGASIQSELMIAYGSYAQATVERGLGLAKKLVIDQHFSERGRYPRLLGVLEDNPGYLGLGVDEDTAVLIAGNTLSVLGLGRATIFVGPRFEGEPTSIFRLKSGESAEAIPVHRTGRGATLGLQKVIAP
jgi:cyanophycinase